MLFVQLAAFLFQFAAFLQQAAFLRLAAFPRLFADVVGQALPVVLAVETRDLQL